MKVKLEGLKNQYENCLSSVKYLDQSILNITRHDDYENELIESEKYCNTSLELLAKISQKLNRIRNKPTIPLTTTTSHHDTLINGKSTLPPGGSKLPKLKIQKPDGKIMNWHTFWDQLESSTDSQENLTLPNLVIQEIYYVIQLEKLFQDLHLHPKITKMQ